MTVTEYFADRAYNRRRVLSMAAACVVAAGYRTSIATAHLATLEAPSSTFLDASLVHDIAVSIDSTMYDAMVETFVSSGDKEWIAVDVTIDGSTYEVAGARLKGNSSLGGLRGGPEGLPPVEETEDGSGGLTPPDETGDEQGNIHVEGGDANADEPEQLPWLIRLDKYVDGQNHEGITELVIRSNRSETSLNEAVALDLLALAGLASQRAAETRFIVNDSDPALRLVIEHPNDAWMAAHFSPDGLLYKAEAGGDWSYRGDDPEAYKDAFDLEAGGTGDDAEDMQPLFDFLAFINDSDDETFAAELPDHLDVDKFATYLAMMDLIENFDDIDGPGNNAYLYVGPDSMVFTVVPWDMNLAFGTAGGNIILREGPGGDQPENLPAPPDGANATIMVDGTPVAGQGAGRAEPNGWETAGTNDRGTPAAAPHLDSTGSGPKPGMPSILVARWNEHDAFTALVDDALSRLRKEVYDSGAAADILSRWVEVLTTQATDMVDKGTIATESNAIAEYFT